LIIGHPNSEEQAVEDSIQMAHRLGIRVMLSEFSPIPGTPDGEQCRRWINLDEPLWHNKTAFTQRRLGATEVNRLKLLVGELNHRLPATGEPTRTTTGEGSSHEASKLGTLPLSASI
jgi:tRNA A37 methylthiotransferase MiaB